MAGSNQPSNKNDTESQECFDEELKNATEAVRDLHLSEKQMEGKIPKLKMPPNYLEMQCPFTWDIFNDLDGIAWENLCREKLKRKTGIDFYDYCYTLFLGCFYGAINKKEEALENFSHCEAILDERSSEPFFKDIVPGMKHITDASRCHFYFKTNKPLLAAQISTSVQPFEELSKESKASVWVVKAYALSNLGYDGKMEAYECSKRAIELDPDEDGSRKGLWYYQAGKIKGQIRHMCSMEEMPSKEELKHLERSVLHNPFPIHYAELADAYRESSKLVRKKYRNFSMSNKLCDMSLTLYKKIGTNNCASIPALIRCATGLMKLPIKYRDVELAEDCLKQVISVDPGNARAYASYGNIEEWHRKDYKAALKSFEKSFELGNNPAGLRAIKLKYQLDKSFNIPDACDKCVSELQKRKESEGKMNQMLGEYFALKGEYYLEVKKDLVAAAREWEKVFDICPNSRAVLEHYCAFSLINPSPLWNLYETLEKRIKYALASSSLDETDADYLNGLLRKCKKEKNENTSA